MVLVLVLVQVLVSQLWTRCPGTAWGLDAAGKKLCHLSGRLRLC